jgi:hypothetical protein
MCNPGPQRTSNPPEATSIVQVRLALSHTHISEREKQLVFAVRTLPPQKTVTLSEITFGPVNGPLQLNGFRQFPEQQCSRLGI